MIIVFKWLVTPPYDSDGQEKIQIIWRVAHKKCSKRDTLTYLIVFMTKGSVMIVDTTSWFSPALRSLGSNLVKITVNISSEWWSCGGWKKTFRTHDCLCLTIDDVELIDWCLCNSQTKTTGWDWIRSQRSVLTSASWSARDKSRGRGQEKVQGIVMTLWCHCHRVNTHTHHPLTILHSIYLIQD